jgi:hypothetical protein
MWNATCTPHALSHKFALYACAAVDEHHRILSSTLPVATGAIAVVHYVRARLVPFLEVASVVGAVAAPSMPQLLT